MCEKIEISKQFFHKMRRNRYFGNDDKISKFQIKRNLLIKKRQRTEINGDDADIDEEDLVNIRLSKKHKEEDETYIKYLIYNENEKKKMEENIKRFHEQIYL